MKILHTDDYAERRRVEYPSVAEQLEELWRLLPARIKASSAVHQKILAIKTKYKKTSRGSL
ncbi:MAG TPA: hypothetical protein VNW52_03395 [Burkholderiaceae bacterium]|jgi:hypothetical protein|nr:hypothetical protein [Burkholderiaceae bacterium]